MKFILLVLLVLPIEAFSKSRVYRQYAGASFINNESDDYEKTEGAFLASELDYAAGYLSKGSSISYYETFNKTEIDLENEESQGKWISDIVLGSYTKLRLPSSRGFFQFMEI